MLSSISVPEYGAVQTVSLPACQLGALAHTMQTEMARTALGGEGKFGSIPLPSSRTRNRNVSRVIAEFHFDLFPPRLCRNALRRASLATG